MLEADKSGVRRVRFYRMQKLDDGSRKQKFLIFSMEIGEHREIPPDDAHATLTFCWQTMPRRGGLENYGWYAFYAADLIRIAMT